MRRWRAVMVLGALAVAVFGAAFVLRPETPDPLREATRLAAEEANYRTGLEAGETFARIAGLLNEALEDCDGAGPECGALGAASGYAQVLAAHVLTCTAPGRFEARTSFAEYLAETVLVTGTEDPVPSPPRLPDCR